MGNKMSFQVFFTLEEDSTEGLCISVRPTKYLDELHPHRAISELKTYIERLHDRLLRYDEDKSFKIALIESKNAKKIRGMLFKLETCQEYLCYFLEHYTTIH